MEILVVGLVLFLGVHSARIFFEGARQRFIEQRGEKAWKGLYSLVSLAGFALILYGFGQARLDPGVIWTPPTGLRHAASLLVLLAFVLLAAAYVPGNHIKAKVGHPMVLAVKVWALAHLLVNGRDYAVVLFAAFLVWAVLDFRAARARDRVQGTQYPAGSMPRTLITVVVGVAVWVVFAFWAHAALIGVRPFG
ncbi:MAG: protein NrnU [Betaproteobacteria bacterium]|nr:protein NrnU [Betaproteobacteria bacterium]